MGTKPPHSQLMEYRIGRGEQGVLTLEPYKSQLLPFWRFKTVAIAKESSSTLWAKFLEYHKDQNFPGMDMARKFIQMGMTRAKRYANYKGGRKYVEGKGSGRIEKSKGHEGKEEKGRASEVFREVWERCKAFEGYERLREEWKRQQKEWDSLHEVEKERIKLEEEADVIIKREEGHEDKEDEEEEGEGDEFPRKNHKEAKDSIKKE